MQEELLKLLAGRRGHFQMESGYHSELWFNLDLLFTQPDRLKPFVHELSQRLAAHGIGAVCGPMAGGARLARDIATELELEYLYTERHEQPGATGMFPITYRLPPSLRERARGKLVGIVDDAVSAGSAARGTYDELVACGARPTVLGALFVFGDAAARFAAAHGMSLENVAHMSFGMWSPVDCPLCQSGVPVERVSDSV